uniref:SHSP domain-containing protein n=1 Tax=Crocodylus porosus TaxID=8502 RepID=A0A7M4EEW6_CROPO
MRLQRDLHPLSRRLISRFSGFLTVRQEGRRVTVMGRREKRSPGEDGGSLQEYRELRREMLLPAGLDVEGVTCSLCSDGQLPPVFGTKQMEQRIIRIVEGESREQKPEQQIQQGRG